METKSFFYHPLIFRQRSKGFGASFENAIKRRPNPIVSKVMLAFGALKLLGISYFGTNYSLMFRVKIEQATLNLHQN